MGNRDSKPRSATVAVRAGGSGASGRSMVILSEVALADALHAYASSFSPPVAGVVAERSPPDPTTPVATSSAEEGSLAASFSSLSHDVWLTVAAFAYQPNRVFVIPNYTLGTVVETSTQSRIRTLFDWGPLPGMMTAAETTALSASTKDQTVVDLSLKPPLKLTDMITTQSFEPRVVLAGNEVFIVNSGISLFDVTTKECRMITRLHGFGASYDVCVAPPLSPVEAVTAANHWLTLITPPVPNGEAKAGAVTPAALAPSPSSPNAQNTVVASDDQPPVSPSPNANAHSAVISSAVTATLQPPSTPQLSRPVTPISTVHTAPPSTASSQHSNAPFTETSLSDQLPSMPLKSWLTSTGRPGGPALILTGGNVGRPMAFFETSSHVFTALPPHRPMPFGVTDHRTVVIPTQPHTLYRLGGMLTPYPEESMPAVSSTTAAAAPAVTAAALARPSTPPPPNSAASASTAASAVPAPPPVLSDSGGAKTNGTTPPAPLATEMTAECRRFDRLTWQWEPPQKMARMLAARAAFAAIGVSTPFPSILVSGGATPHSLHKDTGGEPLASVERYNPTTNEWQVLPPLIFGRWHHSMVLVGGSMMYVIGGIGKGNRSVPIECFDLSDLSKEGKWRIVTVNQNRMMQIAGRVSVAL